MVKMLTLFGKDVSKMSHAELKRERRVQSLFLTRMRLNAKEFAALREKEYKNSKCVEGREDKIEFFELYVRHIEALIEEIDYWLARRGELKRGRPKKKTSAKIQAANKERKRNYHSDSAKRHWAAITEDGLSVSWDKAKFDLIASDRGYQTEEMLLSAVAEELQMPRTNAKIAIQGGRFTWGQVLCLGVMLEMTPKEFCDTFLSGYFVERFGEYRAGYDNLDKTILLKKAVKSKPLPREPRPPRPEPQFEEIYVDLDGRPLGEEDEWFDD